MSNRDAAPTTGIGLKKPGQIDRVPKQIFEDRIRSIAKSKRDISWWAEQFFHIVTLDQGLTKIKLYPKQKEMLQFLVDNKRVCVLSGRQCGKTTTYTIFCMWFATLFADKRILICANKLATAIEIMDRIRKAYEQLPMWIKPGILAYNKGEIVFENGSSIKAFSTSSSGARGATGNCVTGNTKIKIRLFKFLSFHIPIKWLKYLCKSKNKQPNVYPSIDTMI